jgi:hypothetical protein
MVVDVLSSKQIVAQVKVFGSRQSSVVDITIIPRYYNPHHHHQHPSISLTVVMPDAVAVSSWRTLKHNTPLGALVAWGVAEESWT